MSKTKQVDYDDRIVEMAATEVMHDAFMTYAEHVTMDRALPRVEDGLKPVQRRILYTLHELGITPDKPYKKCARIVGEALGKYHPAGDSSVYDAMARMAQDFSMRMPLVDGHGNFGSVDGDSPAAMRYTEARMSALALEMLRDLQKDTVPFRPNYDDTDIEPDLLPARYPNLLVNGSSGIAVGLATNIPPHNLGEVIDSVILRMKKPNCTLEDVMQILPAPDFPTGAYVIDSANLKEAYRTGKGKIQVRAKTHIETLKNGKSLIVVTEMPYEVKKAALLEKALQTVEAKKDLFGAIDEIRDESDREGMRAVFEIKKGVDAEKILHLLFKHTDLQTTFGINMMAIADGSPKQLGLLDILDGYISHQKNVVRRRTQYDLEKAEKREHILGGLSIAVASIDRVIQIIRSSKNSEVAKKNLMNEFSLTGVQAQAILDMRLSRLTNLETIELEKELADLAADIARYHRILEDETELVKIIRREILDIKKKYADPRRTQLLTAEEAVLNIDEMALLPREECMIIQTRGGTLKRMSPKSLQRSLENYSALEEKLRIVRTVSSNTANRIYILTSAGNTYILPAIQIPEQRLKESGKSLSALVTGVARDEEIINIFDDSQMAPQTTVWFGTAGGMIKAVQIEDLKARKNKVLGCALREGDRLVYCDINRSESTHLSCVSSDGCVLTFTKEDVPVQAKTAYGVRSIKLKGEEKVVGILQTRLEDQTLVLISTTGGARQYWTSNLKEASRNTRGEALFTGKSLAAALGLSQIGTITIVEGGGAIVKVPSTDIPVESADTLPLAANTTELTEGRPIRAVYQNMYES